MIGRLRRRFIWMSMLAFLLVLIVIIGAINAVNYRNVVADADALMEVLLENQGSFPMEPELPGFPAPPGFSPEVPYESRYFSVTLDEYSGRTVRIDVSRIASVDEMQALEYAQEVLTREQSVGFAGQYRYARQEDGPFLRVIFLDCGRRMDAFRSFLWASAGISLLGYLVVFVLIAFCSRRVVRPIAESYDKQKRFITDAGHEIKTPLSIISADADVLELELEDNEWLEDIRRQTRRLTELTNELVALSRMEETNPARRMIAFAFSDVVAETAASFQALAQTRQMRLECRVQPGLSLRGDERAVERLVSILLENALKYAPPGSTVELSAERQGRSLRLRVSNPTEEPIPAGELPRLFDRFYRLDPSRSSQTGGYGIGLSMAQAIVQAHGGKITASTEGGSALQITVTLPAG